MSGKRLLDAIAVLNAARAVAYNHFSIRRAQVELYARTSSLTRGINGASRASNGVSNAAHFSRRSASAAANAKPNSNLDTPEPKTVEGEGHAIKGIGGIAQDHHYDRSKENSVTDSIPTQDLEVQQEKAKTYPLADGTVQTKPSGPGQATTNGHDLSPEDAMKLQRQSEAQIPSRPAEPPTAEALSTGISKDGEGSEFGVEQDQDVFYQPPDSTAPVLSALPRVKIPKIEEDVQGGDPHIPQKINADVFYSSRNLPQDDLAKQMEIAQEEPSEEIMNSLFHSPRVARLLSTKSKNLPDGIRPNGSRTYVTSRPIFAQGDTNSVKAHSEGSVTRKRSDSDAASLQELAADLSVNKEMQLNVSTSFRAPQFAISADQLTAKQQPPRDTGAMSAKPPYEMRESRVPSSQLGRLWEFGGLAASMAFGAAGERFNRSTSHSGEQASLMLSAGNMDRLVAKLSKMRGAALKLGQMMSFQG